MGKKNTFATPATDPLRNFRFLVTMTPVAGSPATAKTINYGFTSVSGLAQTTEAIPYREGGYNSIVHQLPGQTTVSPITMSRGVVIGTDANWRAARRLFTVIQGDGDLPANKNFRYTLDIRVLAHPATVHPYSLPTPKLRFRAYNAWMTSIAYSDLNAGDNALLVEQVTFVHEGFDVKWAKDVNSQAPAF